MKEWRKVRLGDCIRELNERTTVNNQYEILTSSKNGIFSQEEYFDKQVASKDNIGYKIIKKGQFTYRSMSDSGSFTINRLENKEIGMVSPAYPVFEAVDINGDYLKYFFESSLFKQAIHNLSQGSTRTALKYKDLSNIYILLPSIKEQEKIVEILKLEDMILSKNVEKILYYKQFSRTVFEKLFNGEFEKCKLNEVCDVRDGTHDSPVYLENSPYKFITTKNLIDGKISMEEVKYISEKDYIKFNERSKVNCGDILMPMIGTVGNPIIVDIKDEDIDFSIKNVSLIKFYSNSKVNNVYIKSLLASDNIKRKIELTKKGGTQQFISLKDIRNLEVKVPPMILQEQFRNFVEKNEKIEKKLQIQQKNIVNLKKALMQQLLTGKVRVKI